MNAIVADFAGGAVTSNPWISHVQPSPEAPRAAPVPLVHPTGPTTPQAGVTAPDRVDQLPVREFRASAHLWLVGVHGGAGESTLARLIPGGEAAGHSWPLPPANSYIPIRVLLVARSNAAGLEAARKTITHWASGALHDVQLVGLVIIADAPGRLPRPLRHLADHVAGAPPRTWHMPWVEAWRLGEHVGLDSSPSEVRRIVTEITSVLPPQGAAPSGIR